MSTPIYLPTRSSSPAVIPIVRRTERDRLSFRVLLAGLVIGASIMLVPFVPWLTLAAWFAALAAPAMRRLTRAMGDRHRAAALLTVLLFVAFVTPIVIIALSVWADASELVSSMRSARSPAQALTMLVSSGQTSGVPLAPRAIAQMVRDHADQALGLVGSAVGVTADLALGLFVFFSSAYVFATEGARFFTWIEEHAPIAPRHVQRLGAAFQETGRGLMISVGLTGLLQAVVATIAYAALGVPRALVLGLLTLFASLIPSVGTALIWAPVAVGLFLAGHRTEALILAVVGTGVVSSIDNFVRPLFARWGKLELHGLVVLLSMLGGLAVIGGWGLILGPLVARLALEALRIAREEKMLA